MAHGVKLTVIKHYTKSKMQRQKYIPPKAHAYKKEWFEGLDERHKALHELAQKMLQSSYFADRTHGISKIIKQQQPK
jgi:hypothetical protein